VLNRSVAALQALSASRRIAPLRRAARAAIQGRTPLTPIQLPGHAYRSVPNLLEWRSHALRRARIVPRRSAAQRVACSASRRTTIGQLASPAARQESISQATIGIPGIARRLALAAQSRHHGLRRRARRPERIAPRLGVAKILVCSASARTSIGPNAAQIASSHGAAISLAPGRQRMLLHRRLFQHIWPLGWPLALPRVRSAPTNIAAARQGRVASKRTSIMQSAGENACQAHT